MSYFLSYIYSKNKTRIEWDLSNDPTKPELKTSTGADTSQFAEIDYLANLKW